MAIDDTFRRFMGNMKLPDWNQFDLRTPVEALRTQFFVASRAIETDVPQLAEVMPISLETPIGPLSARKYTPLGAGIGPGPGIVFFHGGGFVLGDLDSHDMICRRLADAARTRVIAVDYRLAPEHTFPAAHDDARAAWQAITDNAEALDLDPARLAVCGDSAGGNLSIYIAQEGSAGHLPAPAFQLLLYPLLQFVDIRSKKMSMQESGFFISANLFEYFRDSYLANEDDRADIRVSPLFADETRLKRLPPAHIVLCGWDPLKDEGRAYADKMASYGIAVTVQEHPGMVHGFMNLTAMSDAIKDAIKAAGHVTGRALGSL